VKAIYIAVCLTFSSTIIIVKLLSDKRELDEPHGRIAVGFLIVQDIVVVIVMIALSAVVGQGQALGPALAMVLLKGLAALVTILVVVRYVFPRLLPHMAGSPELLILAAIAWAVLLAAGGEALGFSREVGAFVAGVSLASTAYREAIGARLVSLRDFLLVFFFIDLGARVQLDDAGGQLIAALVLSAFVLIGNPLIVMILMGMMGYRRRVGFLAGLTVAQISEFSLILAALGLALGHIDSATVSLITVVGLITIGISTYLILYSYPLYDRLAPHLGIFERRSLRRDHIEVQPEVNVVLFGAGRYGSRLTAELTAAGLRVLVVDHDPQALARLPHPHVQTLYGDAEEPELALALPMTSAGCVVSTIPNRDVNLSLLNGIRAAGFTGPYLATAHNRVDARLLRGAGVDVVLDPFTAAAEHSSELIRKLTADTTQ
jgi:Kef-type K+ transport system membrane component KefB